MGSFRPGSNYPEAEFSLFRHIPERFSRCGIGLEGHRAIIELYERIIVRIIAGMDSFRFIIDDKTEEAKSFFHPEII